MQFKRVAAIKGPRWRSKYIRRPPIWLDNIHTSRAVRKLEFKGKKRSAQSGLEAIVAGLLAVDP